MIQYVRIKTSLVLLSAGSLFAACSKSNNTQQTTSGIEYFDVPNVIEDTLYGTKDDKMVLTKAGTKSYLSYNGTTYRMLGWVNVFNGVSMYKDGEQAYWVKLISPSNDTVVSGTFVVSKYTVNGIWKEASQMLSMPEGGTAPFNTDILNWLSYTIFLP